jgi:dihydrodipicolinate synthase/N-acetylneuraminate lyase
MRFEGIYTPIVTPCRDDFSIDRDRFADTVEHLIGAPAFTASSSPGRPASITPRASTSASC